MSSIEQLVSQAKTCFQAKDYEACMTLTDEALRVDPGNTEATWLMKEAQRQWEDQRSLEQLEIYVENLKKEAMDLFDKEHYEQCLGMFRFLSELEPDNLKLREYVKLSQQMFVETIGSGDPPVVDQADASSSDSQFQSIGLVSNKSDVDTSGALLGADALEAKSSAFDTPTLVREITTPQPLILKSEAIPESAKSRIIQEYVDSTMASRQKRSQKVALTTALLLATTLGAGCLWFYSTFLTSRIEIQSAPARASVYINSKKMGETPFSQEDIPAGSYSLRIEKQGYRPDNRNVVIERAQSIILQVQLEKARDPESSTIQPKVISAPQSQPLTPQLANPNRVETEVPGAQIAQSVIHHHLLGSCTGRLKISGDRISFWSSGNSRDAFTRKIRQITRVELADKLLIEFKDKAYRFEALARDPKDNRQRLTTLLEQIKLRKNPPLNAQ
jgi:hypothetical protein